MAKNKQVAVTGVYYMEDRPVTRKRITGLFVRGT